MSGVAKEEPVSGEPPEGSDRPMLENFLVCVTHKRFIPCRPCGEPPTGIWSSDLSDVMAVRGHQRSEEKPVSRDRSGAPREPLAALNSFSSELLHVQNALGLDNSELATLFEVNVKTIAEWVNRGVGQNHQGKLFDVLATVELLEKKVKEGELPRLAREPALRLKGMTLLEALAADPSETRKIYEHAFNWSSN